MYAMGWIGYPQRLYVEALISNVTAFEDKTFKEIIKVKWDHMSET